MATDEAEISLELSLNKATNPALREEDAELIHEFCEQVNKDLDGPGTAVRLIAHKIQSPQEREALYALATVEACVRNCGKRFHAEIGKFRFLNEVIKTISPKYLGGRTSERVKKRCIELMYSWHKGLPNEMKVSDAYKMLKQQGIVKEDPTYIDKEICNMINLPPERPRNASFEDEEKAKTLAKLLRSKSPEDLQAANRLIKNMVKQDNERMERTSRRINELETIQNNSKLLMEMLENFNVQTSTQSDREMMHELHESLQKLRPKLFRLASETDEKDNDGLTEILKANDEVSHVMTMYKQKVEGVHLNGEGQQTNAGASQTGGSSLLDLNFDQSGAGKSSTPPRAEPTIDDELLSLGMKMPNTPTPGDSGNLLSDLDDLFSSSSPQTQAAQNFSATSSIPQAMNQPVQQGMMPGMTQFMGHNTVPNMGFPPQQVGAPVSAVPAANYQVNTALSSLGSQPSVGAQQPINNTYSSSVFGQAEASFVSSQGSMARPAGAPQAALSEQQLKAMQDLDELGGNLLRQTLGGNPPAIQPPPTTRIPLSQMVAKSKTETVMAPSMTGTAMASSGFMSGPGAAGIGSGVGAASAASSPSPAKTTEVLPLTNLSVPLEKIQPGSTAPVTAYEKNCLKVMIHLAKDRPREDVSVMVVSVMSTNTVPIKSFIFQAAVPKSMKVRLQPPSATDLPAFNPILPMAAITQVMLLANPQKEKIRLKFKVSYTMNDEMLSDVGDVDTLEVH